MQDITNVFDSLSGLIHPAIRLRETADTAAKSQSLIDAAITAPQKAAVDQTAALNALSMCSDINGCENATNQAIQANTVSTQQCPANFGKATSSVAPLGP